MHNERDQMEQQVTENRKQGTMRAFILLLFTLALVGFAPEQAIAQETSGGFVGGSVKIGYDNRTCVSGLAGSIRYNSATSCAEYCDGASWACPSCAVTWDSFADLENQPSSTLVQSSINLVTTSGCSPEVTVSGDGSPQYRICSDATCSAAPAFTSTSAAIDSGEYIQAQMTSSASSGATSTATVAIGPAATEWTVTTSGIPEFVAAETATSAGTAFLTITKPVATVENNLMIAALSRDNDLCAMSAPVGWTEIRQDNVNAATHRYAYFYKLATAAEPADYDFTICDDGENVVGAIATFSGNSTSSPIDVNAGAQGDSTTATAPSVTTTIDETLLVAIAVNEGGGGHSPPTGYTERVDISQGLDNDGQSAALTITTREHLTAGSSGTAIFTNVEDHWHAEHIAIRKP